MGGGRGKKSIKVDYEVNMEEKDGDATKTEEDWTRDYLFSLMGTDGSGTKFQENLNKNIQNEYQKTGMTSEMPQSGTPQLDLVLDVQEATTVGSSTDGGRNSAYSGDFYRPQVN